MTVPVAPDAVRLLAAYNATQPANSGSIELTVSGEGGSLTRTLAPTGGAREFEGLNATRFAGETVTVSVDAAGGTSHLYGFAAYDDTDGDGLVDAFETDEHYDAVTGVRVATDPELADTDGDGLLDGEEVEGTFDADGWQLAEVTSDPGAVDSDGDGLDDREELEVWETDPLSEDTDGDGILDRYDPAPATESSVPTVTLRGTWEYGLTFRLQDESGIESTTIEAVYRAAPDSERNVTIEPVEITDVRQLNETTVAYDVQPEPGPADEYPVGYVVNATDETGNELSVPLAHTEQLPESSDAVQSRGSPGVVAVGGVQSNLVRSSGARVLLSPAQAVKYVRWTARSTGLGAAVLAWLSYGTGTASAPETVEQTTYPQSEAGLPAGATAAEYRLEGVQTPSDQRELTLELPSGATWEREGSRQGYGLASIEAAGLTQAQVEHALTHRTQVVVEDGEVRAIVGDGTDGGEKVIVSIIGGTIVAASSQPAYDQCSETTVRLDKTEDWKHSSEEKPDKPFNGEESTVISAFEDVVTVLKGSNGKWYHIIKVGPNRYTVAVTLAEAGTSGKALRYLQTFLTNIQKGRTFFDSLQNTINYIDRSEFESYERVDCT